MNEKALETGVRYCQTQPRSTKYNTIVSVCTPFRKIKEAILLASRSALATIDRDMHRYGLNDAGHANTQVQRSHTHHTTRFPIARYCAASGNCLSSHHLHPIQLTSSASFLFVVFFLNWVTFSYNCVFILLVEVFRQA